LGPVNGQTAWALEQVGLDAPELLADASPRFQSVARRLDSITPDRSLTEAWAIASRTGTVAPLVEQDGTPFGLITGMSLFNYISDIVGPHPSRQEMKLSEIFNRPCKDAADTAVPIFQENARIRDSLHRILRQERTHFWVVDQEGRYVGVCRQADLLNPPRMRLVLVDHNEQGQSIPNLEEADLLEVLDHHRLGNPPTHLPIQFQIEPVGSTSTLVSEKIEEAGLSPPPDLAGLLLAGLVSDTLLLSSPTTTERDKAAADRLGRWAFAGGGRLQGEDVASFGQQVLSAGAGLGSDDHDAVVSRDLKIYDTEQWRFGIAQVEVTDIRELDVPLNGLKEALDRLTSERSLNFAMLMVTDIVASSSRIIVRDAPPILDELPYQKLGDGTLDATGVVSRKKQFLPVVLALLEG
jgi:manganese-dependent inorganic pyrophosphatase